VALLGCGRAVRHSPADVQAVDGGTAGLSASSGGPDAAGGGGREAGGRGGGGGRDDDGGRSGSDPQGGGSDPGGESGCVPDTPPDAPIRRLNRFAYENSLRELVGEQNFSPDALPPDPYEDPLAIPTLAVVQAQHDLAHDVAQRVTETESTTYEFIGCDPDSEQGEDCRDRFIAEFVERVFRRPATDGDLERFTTKFDEAASGGFPLGVRAVVEIALQSPEFLYLPEFGEKAPDRDQGWARPTSFEMASRLAYFLWGSPPDAELLDAARAGALQSPDEVEAQARRMLGDGRASKAVGYFYLRLLELDGATFPAAGRAEYPTFTPEVAASLLAETESFVGDVTLVSNGDFRTLLTAPYTFVNEPLAAFYGIPGVTGSELRAASVDAYHRGGLLTQASFLAATALGPFTNPSERGFRVAEGFLCADIPREPSVPAVPEPLPPNTTTRERYAQGVASPACATCHAMFDPLGFAFEAYDAAGLYRDSENGVPVDATGTLLTTDVAGDFDGALELSERLAGSADARRCFVQQWFAFAHGRAATPADACFLDTLEGDFVDAGTNLKELLVALVRNDAFLHRPEVAP